MPITVNYGMDPVYEARRLYNQRREDRLAQQEIQNQQQQRYYDQRLLEDMLRFTGGAPNTLQKAVGLRPGDLPTPQDIQRLQAPNAPQQPATPPPAQRPQYNTQQDAAYAKLQRQRQGVLTDQRLTPRQREYALKQIDGQMARIRGNPNPPLPGKQKPPIRQQVAADTWLDKENGVLYSRNKDGEIQVKPYAPPKEESDKLSVTKDAEIRERVANGSLSAFMQTDENGNVSYNQEGHMKYVDNIMSRYSGASQVNNLIKNKMPGDIPGPMQGMPQQTPRRSVTMPQQTPITPQGMVRQNAAPAQDIVAKIKSSPNPLIDPEINKIWESLSDEEKRRILEELAKSGELALLQQGGNRKYGSIATSTTPIPGLAQ